MKWSLKEAGDPRFPKLIAPVSVKIPSKVVKFYDQDGNAYERSADSYRINRPSAKDLVPFRYGKEYTITVIPETKRDTGGYREPGIKVAVDYIGKFPFDNTRADGAWVIPADDIERVKNMVNYLKRPNVYKGYAVALNVHGDTYCYVQMNDSDFDRFMDIFKGR